MKNNEDSGIVSFFLDLVDDNPESIINDSTPEPPASEGSVLGDQALLVLVEVLDGKVDSLWFSNAGLVLEVVGGISVLVKVVSEEEVVEERSEDGEGAQDEGENNVDSGELNLGLLLLGQGWGDQRSDEDESQKKQDGGTNDDDPVQNADEDSGPFAPFSSTTEIIQFKLDTAVLKIDGELSNSVKVDKVALGSILLWDLGLDNSLDVIEVEDILGFLLGLQIDGQFLSGVLEFSVDSAVFS